MEKNIPAIIAHLCVLEDPRIERHKRHKLSDILVLRCARAVWGREFSRHRGLLGRRGTSGSSNFGVAGGDSFARHLQPVFRLLDPISFRRVFLSWMQAVGEETQGRW